MSQPGSGSSEEGSEHSAHGNAGRQSGQDGGGQVRTVARREEKISVGYGCRNGRVVTVMCCLCPFSCPRTGGGGSVSGDGGGGEKVGELE